MWSKREGKKSYPRTHTFHKGQSGELFLQKLSGLFTDVTEGNAEGDISVVKVVEKLRSAFDIERVTKKFYKDFDTTRIAFTTLIRGIDDIQKRNWYASVLLNRLMFIWFLQKKGFLDNGDRNYLPNKLDITRLSSPDTFFSTFLHTLFFEGFAKPAEHRSKEANAMLGVITYLNGGLFLPHTVELEYPNITVPDTAFDNVFALFNKYTWHLDDTPAGKDDEINPDVLGYIFEKYINQKEFGAYYTRPQITEYLCRHTIHKLVLDKVNAYYASTFSADFQAPAFFENETKQPTVFEAATVFTSIDDLLLNADANICRYLIQEALPELSLLDPACGSGAFLVAAMKTLDNIYAPLLAKIPMFNDRHLNDWIGKVQREHRSTGYFIKKLIITKNLYGVDIMEEATEIAKLRLFLSLVATARTPEELEPLPNIDFNIMAGNSLVGLLRIEDKEFDDVRKKQAALFSSTKTYRSLLIEKNRLRDIYRHASTYAPELSSFKKAIDDNEKEARETLNELLLGDFQELKIMYEQAIWDTVKHKEGKPNKRPLNIKDIEALEPFHWGYEFDKILNNNGGFDAIITNPPWEIFKPQSKEFFALYSDIVTKNKMTIKEFEKEQDVLMTDREIRAAWLDYQSRFPHVSSYYRAASQYANQISIVNGKKAGTDINLYKLFTEQCYNLLKKDGYCGIVIPSGIYTDLGTKQLREMLFSSTRIDGLFCFENSKEIFENVHRSFKFVVLTFEKGKTTSHFPAAFMRHDVVELEQFPAEGSITLKVDFIRRQSPDSLSVMEIKNDIDFVIAEKMLRFPALGEKIEGAWNLKLTREFDMTNDSYLFHTEPKPGRLPLYEGKMIHQFRADFAKPKYWVDEMEGRKALLGKEKDNGQLLDYQCYRIAYRDITGSANERTMICTVLPRQRYCPHTMNLEHISKSTLSQIERLVLCATLNSYVFDFQIRQSVASHISFFLMNRSRVPRHQVGTQHFSEIAERTARLICITEEFSELWLEVIGNPWKPSDGATDETARRQIRAEIDAMIAHIYGLTEEEFTYILSTFPLVSSEVKQLTLAEFRRLAG